MAQLVLLLHSYWLPNFCFVENGSYKSNVYLMWPSRGPVSLFSLCANFLLPLAYTHTRTLASLPFSQCSRCAPVPVCLSYLLLECIGPAWSHSALVFASFIFSFTVWNHHHLCSNLYFFIVLSPSSRVKFQKGTEFFFFFVYTGQLLCHWAWYPGSLKKDPFFCP